ncbi:MAG: hypothetical protein WBB76_02295 [Gaiellaceae bacterium]
MANVTIDRSTGSLLVDGRRVFPIGLADAPPLGRTAPNGNDGWAEVAAAGVNFIRTGRHTWGGTAIDAQIAFEHDQQNAAAGHGLHCLLRLGNVGNLGASPSPVEQLLVRITNEFKSSAGLGAYYGVDEPALGHVAPGGLIRAYEKLKALDPAHPVVINQAPRGTVAALDPYRPAFDITGADIYPVSYPPGVHSDEPNKEISVVGDITKKMVAAAGGKPIWMTLQIAWSGVIPTQRNPDIVPRFPTLHEERFMAYQAVIHGARGLFFFGGQLTEVMSPADDSLGWNWTFWTQAIRPLVVELSSPAVQPILLGQAGGGTVGTAAPGVELATRQDSTSLYVVAVRRAGGQASQIAFTGLPRKHDGTPLLTGEVLFEYVQEPLPPPVLPGRQTFRPVKVANNGFHDWFGPLDTHVYRFKLR